MSAPRAILFLLLLLGLPAAAFLVVTRGDPGPRVGARTPATAGMEEVAVISRGEAVDIAAAAVPVGRTVVEFTADW